MTPTRVAVIHYPDRLEFCFVERFSEAYLAEVVKKKHRWIGWGGDLKTFSFTVVNGSIANVVTANGIKTLTSGRRDLGVPFLSIEQMDVDFESMAYRIIQAYLEDVFHAEGEPFEPVVFEHYEPVPGHRVMEYRRID